LIYDNDAIDFDTGMPGGYDLVDAVSALIGRLASFLAQ
jgi:hypothetical protein